MAFELAVMFFLALVSVGMWTFRVAVAAQGRRLASAAAAAAEACVFALTFSHLLADLSSPWRLLGYASGVAAGTTLGLVLTDRTSRGHTELQVVAPGHGDGVREWLDETGWPATISTAQGPHGDVTIAWLTIPDSRARKTLGAMSTAEPEAFFTSRPVHAARPVREPIARGMDGPSWGRALATSARC